MSVRATSLLARVDVDAHHAVFPRGPFLRGALKTVESLHDADAGESDAAQHVDKLCLRQSTGDSTRPEIDIVPDRLGEFVRDDDVSVQELATGLENAPDFSERLLLVGCEIQHTIRDRDVNT